MKEEEELEEKEVKPVSGSLSNVKNVSVEDLNDALIDETEEAEGAAIRRRRESGVSMLRLWLGAGDWTMTGPLMPGEQRVLPTQLRRNGRRPEHSWPHSPGFDTL